MIVQDTESTEGPEVAAPLMRVVVVDDHPLVLSGIKTALSRVEGLQVVAEATTGDGALEAVLAHKPDLLILDISMPGLRADQVVLQARVHLPELKTLILSAFDDDVYIRRFSQVPINGYMLKDEAPEGLAQAVRVIQQGAMWFSHSVASRILAMNRVPTQDISLFSDREKEVLGLLLKGLDNQAIATSLSLARQTVRNLVSTIYQKMGVNSRIQAAVWAQDHNHVVGQPEADNSVS